MPLDPNIILGIKAPQFDMAQFSPVNALMSAMKIKQLEQEGEINALTLNERKRLQDFLGGNPDIKSENTRYQLATQFGESGRKLATTATEIGKAQTDQLDRASKLKTDQLNQTEKKLTLIGNIVTGVKDQPSWLRARAKLQQLDPDQSFPDTYDPQYVEESKATVLGAQKALEQHFATVDLNGEKRVLAMPKYAVGGAPTTIGTFTNVPLPAAVEAQKIRVARESRPVTSFNLPPQEKSEQADRGKMLIAEYSAISQAAKLAAKTLPSLDANLNILGKGFETGFGTETKAVGASVLAALGVANADKFATNAQIFQSKATEAVLQKQLEQKGPQTESDAKRIDAVGSQLGKTSAANKFVLTIAKEQLKRDMEQRNFYDAWWKNNKTYDGAEDAWISGEGGKSLFDRPALKQYAGKPQDSAAAQIPTTGRATPAAGGGLAQERAAAAAAIAAGAPAAAVRARFKQNTGQEF